MMSFIERAALTALLIIATLVFVDTVHKHGGVRQAITAISSALTSQDGNAGVP